MTQSISHCPIRPSSAMLPDYFDVILKKVDLMGNSLTYICSVAQGTRVSGEKELQRSYHVESTVPIRARTKEIMCFREDPRWLDTEQCAYISPTSCLCLQFTTSLLQITIHPYARLSLIPLVYPSPRQLSNLRPGCSIIAKSLVSSCCLE